MSWSRATAFLISVLIGTLCIVAEGRGISTALAQSGDASFVLTSPATGAVGEAELEAMQEMNTRISLDLRSTDVTDALKYLAKKGALNISVSKKVTGRVNLFLEDVTIRNIFDIILRTNELAYDKTGSVYNIMTEQEYQALYGRKFNDLREVRTFRLEYAVPQRAFDLLDTLKSSVGRLLVDEDSGTVMVIDTPERLREMDRALSVLEGETEIQIFDLRYASALDVEQQLSEHLEVNKLGTVRADERSNQVIVKTLSTRMKEVEMLVARLDRKTRQVLIDTKIVKVSLNDQLDTGIDWNNVFSNLKFHGMSSMSDFRAQTTGVAPADIPGMTFTSLPFNIKADRVAKLLGQPTGQASLLFGTIAKDGYELFRFLETVGQTKIMSNPKLLVTENMEAKILVGTREAFVTTTTTTGQTTSTTAEEVEFIDVGIQLSVTPRITDNGYVLMKVVPEVSDVVRTLKTPSANEIPIVDTSTAETEVLVMDGSTVIIGGLRKNQKKRSHAQIPLIARIPILGEPFRQRDQEEERSELIVFITPHIVEGNRFVTGDEREFGGAFKSFRDYQPVFQPGDYADAN